MTINELNQWQNIIRSYNKAPIPYTDMVEKSAKEGIESVPMFLKNNNYIGIMKDGNTFINWTKNQYYPEATIINLKAELSGESRPLTLEERVELLEKQVEQLLKEKINEIQ